MLKVNNLLKIDVLFLHLALDIGVVKNLKFSNLKIMYISRNNLSSLKFLKDVICKNLESFWAINNNITDYNDILELPYKSNIIKINLKGNKIKYIDDLL